MRGWGLNRGFSDLPTANATLRAQGTPPVQSVIFSAAKQVKGGGAGRRAVPGGVGGAGAGTY